MTPTTLKKHLRWKDCT